MPLGVRNERRSDRALRAVRDLLYSWRAADVRTILDIFDLP